MNKVLLFASLLAVAVIAEPEPENVWWKTPLEQIKAESVTLHPDVAGKGHFVAWVKEHDRKYHHSELETRYRLWKKSVRRVHEHNNANKTWVAGVNMFSAHTSEELKNFLGAVPAPAFPDNATRPQKRFRPSWTDWTKKGVVTSVKNQGGCGSCWAFSSSGALEGGKALANKGLVDLSPQHIIDCGGIGGCGGGDPNNAIKWGSTHVASWNDYPYVGQQQGCRSANSQVSCTGFEASTNGNDDSAADLISGGPASICFNVINDFFNYKGGVFGENCEHKCTHAVLAVGYAENCNNSGKNCYIIKNSWGSGWGTGGYFLIERGSNMCGIADYLGRPTNC